MADAAPALPPLDRMFITGIWIETVLYGMNCIIFAGAVYVLLGKRSYASPNFLIYVSIWLFTLSTAHVALVLRQLLEAFIFGPPGGASLYFSEQSRPIPVTKLVIYITNVFSQDLILIWRLWVVWSKNWKIVVIPLVVEAIHVAAAYRAAARGAQPGVPVFDSILHSWAIVTWTLDLAVNVGVTAAIVYRLYSVARSTSRMRLSRNNQYVSIILMLVESGTLFASATIVVVSLYLSNNIAVVVALDSVIQIATLTPLLIFVRVGLARAAYSNTSFDSKLSTKPGSTGQTMVNMKQGVQINTSVEYEMSALSTVKDAKGDDRLV